MKTLSSPITTQKDADQSGWAELYDFYLKSAISTPWGTISTIRLTTLPGDLAFFTPNQSPEPLGTRANAATYHFWPISREIIRSASKTANDKLVIAASNVTTEWATMLAAVDWYDTPVIIRKISTTIAVPTADDCLAIFAGLIDSVKTTNQQIQFTCSNDLAGFSTIAPRENMHQNCRFGWGDDQCTAIRYLSENYKAKTIGSGSTTTRIKSAGLTEDSAAPGYIAQAVTADSTTDKISLTAHGLGNGDRIRFAASSIPGGLTAGTWYYVVSTAANDFKVSLTDGGAAVDITSNGTGVLLDSSSPYGTDLIDPLADGAITASSEKAAYSGQAVTFIRGLPNPVYYGTLANHGLSLNDPVQLGGTAAPAPLSLATTYYFIPISANYSFELAAIPGGDGIHCTNAGTAVTLSTLQDFNAKRVRTTQQNYWRLGTTADWGTLANGYWSIPAGQEGLANAALKPYIQFDFGSAKQPKIWRVSCPLGATQEEVFRLIVFFASTDAATWGFEGYFEMPIAAGKFYDVLIPKASNKRYWRICIRSKWVEQGTLLGFYKVRAFETSRNWWASGQVKFDAATATVALRNVRRPILASYSGAADVGVLPVAPANGDTFVIERGCSRSFNACAERRNTENFGGFLDLPNQSVIR